MSLSMGEMNIYIPDTLSISFDQSWPNGHLFCWQKVTVVAWTQAGQISVGTLYQGAYKVGFFLSKKTINWTRVHHLHKMKDMERRYINGGKHRAVIKEWGQGWIRGQDQDNDWRLVREEQSRDCQYEEGDNIRLILWISWCPPRPDSVEMLAKDSELYAGVHEPRPEQRYISLVRHPLLLTRTAQLSPQICQGQVLAHDNVLGRSDGRMRSDLKAGHLRGRAGKQPQQLQHRILVSWEGQRNWFYSSCHVFPEGVFGGDLKSGHHGGHRPGKGTLGMGNCGNC